MGHAMIKPFEILETRTEADGSTGVMVKVQKVTAVTTRLTTTNGMVCYMQVPVGRDVDLYLFEEFSKAGSF